MRKYIIVAVATALLASLGTVALASHFSDVPDDHPFHDEIASLAAAGITTGFADGTFRPSQGITRQAMAAFMERGFGRLGFDGVVDSAEVLEEPTVNTFGTTNPTITALTAMFAGASGGGQGYVLLEGNVRMFGDTGCPCIVIVEIIDFSGATLGWTYEVVGLDEVKNVSLQAADTLPADAADIFGMRITQFFGLNGDVVETTADLSAVYIPFDLVGTNETTYPAPATDLTPSLDADALADGSFDIGGFPAMTPAQQAAFEGVIPDALKP